ncbi:ricin-type beta-trefoil lectin domain protein [Lentzea nigeriaca]|uniref:ricin-type beta-trefoil lectin domain protein n=1 Tax=Lentzea nigeriaca TaxID=1128665 RepID=UPI00195B36E9|nr:ricin-type beta-trefoil lectin domain protein [Lentzea nigeriaca]MBM7859117.1 poly(3-hydroxybutyrate) depolymerase [Lentzea nigeriaca]
MGHRKTLRKAGWLVAAAALIFSGPGVASAQAPPASAGQISATATPGCGKAPTLRNGNQTIQTSGKTRSFILSIPDNYDNTKQYRLVFGFHWLGGTSDQVAGGGSDGAVYAYYGLKPLSNNSTIFVAPQGFNNGWGNSGGEDVKFVDDMISRIENDLCVDTTQLFSLGFSYGGSMSISLACSRPTVFRAIAAIASPGEISGCAGGTAPVAYMGIHGINDNIGGGRGQRDRWVRNNGCTPQNAPEPGPNSRTHITTYYSGCKTGYPVVWAPFDGGHQQGPVDGCGGCESGARSWVKTEVWKFFTGDTTPPNPGPTPFRLRGEASSRCLDVNGAGTANGTQMIVWDCHTNANQQFTQNGQTLQVTGKCLDVPNNAGSGTRVRIWDCNGGANQNWNVANGTVTNVQSGLCLTAGGTNNGAAVTVATCQGGTNQRWAKA